jgi:hypothetical protein
VISPSVSCPSLGIRPAWGSEAPGSFRALAFGPLWLFYLQVARNGPNRIILHRLAIHLQFISLHGRLLFNRLVRVLAFLPAGGQSGEGIPGIVVIVMVRKTL